MSPAFGKASIYGSGGGGGWPPEMLVVPFVGLIGVGTVLAVLYIFLRRLGYLAPLCECCRCAMAFAFADDRKVGSRGSVATLRNITRTTTLDLISTPILKLTANGDAEVGVETDAAHDNATLDVDDADFDADADAEADTQFVRSSADADNDADADVDADDADAEAQKLTSSGSGGNTQHGKTIL